MRLFFCTIIRMCSARWQCAEEAGSSDDETSQPPTYVPSNDQAADENPDENQEDADEKDQHSDADGESHEDSDDGEGESDADGEGDADADEGEKGDKKPKKPEDSKEDDDKEPPVRKRLSVQDHIIGRQHKKLERQRAKQQTIEDAGDEDADADAEIDVKDEILIRKVVEPMLAPLVKDKVAAEDDQEVKDFLKDHPDFKPYEAKVRKFMAHPSRQNLPIKSIFYEVAGDDLMKLGAKRKEKADDKARHTQSGGGSNRGADGGQKPVKEMTPEEFAARQERIRHGNRQ